MEIESKRELEARQHLEEKLEPGEELLAYTKGKIVGIVRKSHIYYIGLTTERLIFLPAKYSGTTPVLTIWRENIEALNWSGLWNRMKIRVPKGVIDVASTGGRWKRRTRELVDAGQRTVTLSVDPSLLAQRQIRQVKTFRELELIASAHAMIEKVQSSSDAKVDLEILKEISEKRLALRVGAGFLFANIGLGLLLIAIVLLTSIAAGGGFASSMLCVSIVPIAIDMAIGINLWRGRGQQWAAWAVLRAAVGMIVFSLIYLSQGAFLDFLAQISFCGSLILVLTGKGKRVKTWVAIAIYVVGDLVVLISLALAFLTPLFAGG